MWQLRTIKTLTCSYIFFLSTVGGWCLQLWVVGYLSRVWSYHSHGKKNCHARLFILQPFLLALHNTQILVDEKGFLFFSYESLFSNKHMPNCKRKKFHSLTCFVKPKHLWSLQTLKLCIMCPSLISNMRWQKREVLLFLTNNLWLCQHMTICQSFL